MQSFGVWPRAVNSIYLSKKNSSGSDLPYEYNIDGKRNPARSISSSSRNLAPIMAHTVNSPVKAVRSAGSPESLSRAYLTEWRMK